MMTKSSVQSFKQTVEAKRQLIKTGKPVIKIIVQREDMEENYMEYPIIVPEKEGIWAATIAGKRKIWVCVVTEARFSEEKGRAGFLVGVADFYEEEEPLTLESAIKELGYQPCTRNNSGGWECKLYIHP